MLCLCWHQYCMNSLSFFFLRKSSSVTNANKKVKSNLLNRVSYFRSPAHFIHVPGFLEASWVRSPCIIALFRTHIRAFYLMYCSSVCGECVVVFIWSKLSLCWKSRPGGTFKDYRGIVMAVSLSPAVILDLSWAQILVVQKPSCAPENAFAGQVMLGGNE